MDTSDIARPEREERIGVPNTDPSPARLSLLAAATLFLSSAFPGLAQAQAVSFAPPRDFVVGSGPQWVAVGDFDRDGLQDLAVANRYASDVSVLLGNGDGTFQATRTFLANIAPVSVAVGDFNDDGVQDLVTANYNSNDVSVLLGNGDGTFRAPVNFPAGPTPNCVAVGDFNRDGREDLAVAAFGNGDATAIAVLLGNGDGTFQTPRTSTTGRGPLWVTVGDLNGDGLQDLAVANFNGNASVSVLLGNGDGTFQAARNVPVDGAASVAVGDFNVDGRQDLAVTGYYSGELVVLLGNGDGTFAPAVLYTVDLNPLIAAVGDLNGDGVEDAAVANWNQNGGNVVSVLVGNGDGTLQPAQSTIVGRGIAAAVMGDFNGDGSPDLAVPSFNGDTLSVLINTTTHSSNTLTLSKAGTGSGTVTSSPPGINCGGTCSASYNGGTVVTLTATPVSGSIFAGWSGGGCSGTGACTVTMNAATAVMATFDVQSQTYFLTVSKPGTGSGTVTSSPAGIACGAACSASYNGGTVVTLTATPLAGSTFAGWSGEGCSETGGCTVTMNATTSVSATFTVQTFPLTVSTPGTGNGTVTSNPVGINCGATCSASYNYGTPVTLSASPAGGSTFTGWSGGGCSGTGACTVTVTSNATVTAGFAGSTPVSAPVLKWQYGGCLAGPYCDTGWYSSPAVADLDGDGQPDVVWGSYDVVALNGANGSLKWTGPNGSRVWSDIAVADLTGDGTPEVIVGRGADQITVYNRLGGVVWTRNPFGGGEVRSLAVADLETDGQLEIVAGSASTATTFQVSVFEPNGTVRSGWPARHAGDPGYGAGLFNENLAVADMNGDGFKEVFGPTASHYITALDRSGNQLGVNGIYAPRQFWSQVGVGVDNAVDLRGFANCGVEHRPNFENSAPVVADVNGDGIPEVIVVGDINDCAANTSLYQMPFVLKLDRTRWSGNGFDWTVIPAPGLGSAPRSVDYGVIETAVPNPVVVDLDGDGFREILFPSYDGKLHAYWLDKTEHGSWPYTIPTAGLPGDNFRFASEPVVVDLNNDGHPEVIFTSWPKKATGGVGQLHVLNYLGVELFRVSLPAPGIGDTWNGGLSAPTIANIDADLDLEVVAGTASSGVVAYDLPNSAQARVLWGTGRGSYRRTGTPPPSP